MNRKEVEKYILISLVVLVIFVCFLIIKPFINVILVGIILAYVFHPFYKKLVLKLKNKYVASIITLLLILIILILPLVLLTDAIVKESVLLYKSGTLEKVSDFTLKLFGSSVAVNEYLEKSIESSVGYLNKIATNFIISIPNKILTFFIMLFIIFYTLLHGEEYLKKIKGLIPIKNRDKIINYMGKTTRALIYGLFLIAILELLVTAIGFKIVGVSTPILWGILVAILAFIPIVGPAIVWVPLTLIEFFNSGEKAIGILIVGIILTIIDNVFRPHIIGAKAGIHPVISLVGVLGGLKLFGIAGIIIGPLLLSLLVSIIEVYINDGIKN